MASKNSTHWGCCETESDTSSFITCTQCMNAFHYTCLMLDEESITSEQVLSWVCSICASHVPKGNQNDNTPARNISTNRGNKKKKPNSPPEVDLEANVTREDVRDIMEKTMETKFDSLVTKFNSMLVSALNYKLAPIEREIAEIKSSMSFMNESYEKMLKEQEESRRMIKEMQGENEGLKSTVLDLTSRVAQLEQHARSKNVEIQCLPEKKHENLMNIVKTLGKTIGCEITDADIQHCTRVTKINPNSTRPRAIVAQFAAPRLRDSFLARVTVFNKSNPKAKLNATHAGLREDNAIYVTEHLTPALKDLHYAARTKAKKMGYDFVWIRNGRIFVRKSADSDYIWIKDTKSLDKIV
ncbi:hypothetical protein ABMA28_013008 [Loxostege sticticalis]|uniref:Zinc finger PHD-type domain-containing protein n=1 Tax=Loxostege sticticalis TaxID=481309 RepID=A0ABD0S3B2_LOXSC